MSWNLPLLSSLFDPVDAHNIKTIQLGNRYVRDYLVWHPNKTGSYSVRMGCHILKDKLRNPNHSIPHTSDPYWKSLWKLNTPPKIINFMWKCSRNSIAHAINLFNRNCAPSNLCPICHLEPETTMHILLMCNHSRATWFSSVFGSSLHNLPLLCFKDWWSAVSNLLRGPQNASLLTFVTMLCWQIWNDRNQLIFSKKAVNPKASVIAAQFYYEKFAVSVGNNSQRQTLLVQNVKWTSPPFDSIKINTDASFLPLHKQASLAGIFRNNKGQMIQANIKGYSKVLIETDSLEVATSINNNIKDCSWEYSSIVQEVKTLFKSFITCSVRYITRNCNSAADWISKNHSALLSLDWIVNIPLELENLLSNDVIP